jgi:membrane-anchored glycerophosphoryl diester phosphodiesterase (GDPDase)
METVAPPRQLKIGTIIDKTLGVIEHAVVPAAIYVAVLAPLTAAITYFTADMTGALERLGVTLVQFVVGVTAAYLLIDAMLRKTGLRTRTDEDVFFAYFALSILYILGLIAGLIALVIPGLVVMARWSLAQPMMIARGDGVMQALGNSWERTKGNEFQIIAAVLALYIVPIALIIASAVMFGSADPVGIVVTQLLSSAMSVLGAAMGVALYGLMEAHRVTVSPTN